MTQVPVVDISVLRGRAADPAADLAADRAADIDELEACAGSIDAACREVGFFLIDGHGVDLAQLTRLDALARQFFALPDTVKAQVAIENGGRAWRGWFAEGTELTSGRPDHKEGIYFGSELSRDDPRVTEGWPLHGPNLFPDEPAALRPVVLEWIDTMTALGQAVLRGISLGLGLAPDWMARHLTADPTVLFRIFRYPVVTDDPGGWGVAEHTDYGLITLLAHDGTPGLQVRPRGTDTWIDVPADPELIVVNLGDMCEAMTQGRYRSTPHRVRRPDAAAAATDGRLSFPFFLDPGFAVPVAPLPIPEAIGSAHDVAPERWDGADLTAVGGTYGDYLISKVAKVFPDLAAHRVTSH